MNFSLKFPRYRRTSSLTFFVLYSDILLPKSDEKVVAVISIVEYVMTTVAYVRINKVVKYHQNQISSHNQLKPEQTRKAFRQKKFVHSQNVFMLGSFWIYNVLAYTRTETKNLCTVVGCINLKGFL